ncbi:MAG: aminotransferase class V-fold PLP-dependent enzyme [Polyangiaceae bacterium]|nr:aminotransferase class V-fold PLP-dependent enzyme [Polyangiaceae bacterium]
MLVSRIEHPSVVRMAEALAREGVRVIWIDPEPSGVVLGESFARAAEAARANDSLDIKLLVLQAVNHETGVIQPVGEVAAVAKTLGALLHVDVVQAVGKLPPTTWAGADIVSVAAHKIRGPKGIGALCTRPGLKVRPILFGGAQERGLRPGTQDPVSCAGFAVAANRARESGPARYAALRSMRDRLEAALAELGGLRNSERREVGDVGGARAPHVANLSWPGWRGDELCAALDLEGLAVSSGSACSAGTAEPSPVITAILGAERASSAVRLSLGENTTESDIDHAIEAFQRVIRRR